MNMDSPLELNLKQSCLYLTALSYWQSNDVKTMTMSFFKKVRQSDFISGKDSILKGSIPALAERPKLEKWENFTGYIIKKIDPNNLLPMPEMLQPELKLAIRQIGFQICKLQLIITYYFKDLEIIEYSDYVDKIFLKNNGTFDLAKTFQATFPRKHNIDLGSLKSFRYHFLRINLSNIILQEFKQHYTIYGIWALEYHTSVYGEFYNGGCFPNVTRELMKIMGIKYWFLYRESLTFDENMLRFCAIEGLPKSVKYFWNKLNDDQKRLNSAYCIVMIVHFTSKPIYCKLDLYVEICLFLISEMKNDDLIQLFKKDWRSNDSDFWSDCHFMECFLKMFLNWPWQSFFVRGLELIWLVNAEEKRTQQFLRLIFSIYNDEVEKMPYTKLHSNHEGKTTRSRMFHAAYCKVPDNIKRLFGKNEIELFIYNLIEIGDLSALKQITHDSSIAIDREYVFKAKEFKWINLAANDKFERLDRYLTALTPDANERLNFKLSVNIQEVISQMISLEKSYTEQFVTLDKFLDWRCSSLEEREDFKGKIEIPYHYQFQSKEDGFEFIKEFSNWKFHSAQEIRNFKDCLKCHQFTWNAIVYDLTVENKSVQETNLEEFLNWLFESKEELEEFCKIKFAQDKILLIYSMKQVLINNGLMFHEKFDDIFNWCSLSREKIVELKQYFFDKVVIQLCDDNLKSVSRRNFKVVRDIIKWSLETEEKVNVFMKEFVVTGSRLRDIDKLLKEILVKSDGNSSSASKDITVGSTSYKSLSDYEYDRNLPFVSFMNDFVKALKTVNDNERRYQNNIFMQFDENESEKRIIRLISRIVSNVNILNALMSSRT